MAPLLHAQMKTSLALCSICSGLAAVHVKVEAQASVVVIHSDATFVLQLLRKDVGSLLVLALAFAFCGPLSIRVIPLLLPA